MAGLPHRAGCVVPRRDQPSRIQHGRNGPQKHHIRFHCQYHHGGQEVMTGPLVGPLNGLRGFVNTTPEATAEQRNGDPAEPYPWEAFPGESHGPYGLANDMLGMPITSYSDAAGYLAQDPTADLQPITHAAPWPKGVPQNNRPDEVAERRAESAAIHSSNMGGSRESLYVPTAQAQQDVWQTLEAVDAGTSWQAPIPKQIAGSSGGWG